MRTNFLLGALSIGIGMAQTTGAATVVVDWLRFTAPGAGGFSLEDDTGTAVAGGDLILVQGFSAPPAARTLNDPFWLEDTGFSDSVTGDRTVSGIGFRVAPSGGAAIYQIEFGVPQGTELVLVVGDLYRSALGATEAVLVSALSDSGSAPVSLAGMAGWDNGSTVYGEDLVWDATAGRLAPAPGADGDSELAFFRIGAIDGPNARVVISIPEGYAGGITGDSITVALGMVVVPEPGAVALAGMAGMFALGRRRRIS